MAKSMIRLLQMGVVIIGVVLLYISAAFGRIDTRIRLLLGVMAAVLISLGILIRIKSGTERQIELEDGDRDEM